ncbi:hypothetical protein OESDEN_03546 [Oesophagostomum dentatum]|uniref:glucuronosyltransferase n=1 Tax=Oesophagostomum dentatum TaxID=61180 RepID=A0A0B1TM51_OESDE|nr:hypothetical protein OESDEN_03546 [Oesophagostomum dentatum]
MPIMDTDQSDKTGVKLTKNVIKVGIDPRVEEMMKKKGELFSKAWAMEPSFYRMMQMAGNMTMGFAYQCQKVFNDDVLMKRLEEEHFDVGIAEPMGTCGFGLFKLLNIRATMAAVSTVHMDTVSAAIGEPVPPCYVPGVMSTVGDRMNILEKLKNIVGQFLGALFFRGVFDKETLELLAETSYVFTNSNPYLDYPRPMLHKTVPIGGIAVSTEPGKNKLSAKWDAILSERNRTVLVSFGSQAKAIYMPHQYM